MFLQIAHSGGGIVLENALLSYSPELRKRIFAMTISSPVTFGKEICADAFHYRAMPWRDPVPWLNFSAPFRTYNNVTTLQSHPDTDNFDHGLKSKTFAPIIRQRIMNYVTSDGKSP